MYIAYYNAVLVVNSASVGLAHAPPDASLKKTVGANSRLRAKLAPTREVGAYALHCVGANFSVGAKICLKNWPLWQGANFFCRRKNMFKKLPSGPHTPT
jgi:hypothetical protein